MLTATSFVVSLELINEALHNIPSSDFRYSINEPTGDFFYDSWVLKDEFKGTVWEKIYNSLPVDKGETRIIQLLAGNCYASHADADDRYHLNLSGNKCFLIDLDNQEFHPLHPDGVWYDMDAGRRHTAANFGNKIRHQLVVRKLLKRGNIKNSLKIIIKDKSSICHDSARFLFDDIISPWLNLANKNGLVDNFKFVEGIVSFDLDASEVENLKNIIPAEIEVIIE